MLDLAVLERDGGTGQAGAQTHQRCALHLGFNGLGIDRQVAVHGGSQRVQLRQPMVDRGLCHVGHHRVKRFMYGNTPGLALGQLAFAIA